MIASDHMAGSENIGETRTELKSPLFKGNEHPVECVSFWFNFGVRCSIEFHEYFFYVESDYSGTSPTLTGTRLNFFCKKKKPHGNFKK